MNTKSLCGKVAIVTGAGRGIGRAIAVGFGSAGAAVCCAARTETEIVETSSQIQREGGNAVARVVDVADYNSVIALFKTAVDSLGGIDIVVINAGVSIDRKLVEESDPEDWKTSIEINLIGAYHTAKAAIPHLRKRGAGKMILIGSGMGHRGSPERSAYACPKAGLWMLTRILAQELHQYNISVNELIPGPVQTALMAGRENDFLAQVGKSEWMKKPEDILPLALFLATQPKIGPTSQSFSLMRRDC